MILPTQDAYRLFHEGTVALAKVEANGIKVNVDYLRGAVKQVAEQIDETIAKLREDKDVFPIWKRMYGNNLKLGSRKQLAKVVFDRMGYKQRGEKTEKGQDTVDERAFSHIKLPFITDYFHWQKLDKLKGTYLEGVLKEVQGDILHPFFHLHVARSFRSGSNLPNFQNMPVRNKTISKWIRSAFIARKGNTLIEIDYSGVEVRIAYCYHKDPTMKKYLEGGGDMHKDMASEVYMLRTEEVSKEGRYCAKNQFVFPQFYGSFYIDCAKALWESISTFDLKNGDGVPLREHLKAKGIKKLGRCDPSTRPLPGTFEHHLQQVERRFWGERFPVYDRWKKKWYEEYLRNGCFQMKTGCVVNGYYKRNDVINYPVQGAAFHCLLWSLIELQKWIERKGLGCLIVGQIHDSILLDCPDNEVERVIKKAVWIMTKKLPQAWPWIIIPLEVEVETSPEGKSWHEKSKYQLSV